MLKSNDPLFTSPAFCIPGEFKVNCFNQQNQVGDEKSEISYNDAFSSTYTQTETL